MKKGFTLMEILAVLLIIAVIVSAAVPVFRAVRFDMKNSQAKTAAKKLAESVRSYYQNSKGSAITSVCFTPNSTWVSSMASAKCNTPNTTGIPQQSIGSNVSASDVNQLFACGYLTVRDFINSPYKYCVCNPLSSSQSLTDCANVSATAPYAAAYAVSESAAGKKYYSTVFEDGKKIPHVGCFGYAA